MKNKSASALERSLFPAIAALVSLVFFIIIYSAIMRTVIDPHYLMSLLLAIPFVLFGLIFILAVKDKISSATSNITTGILIIPLAIAMAFILLFFSLDAATKTTTDINRYERALKLSNFPSPLVEHSFPDTIPAKAENILFKYHPALGQGGEVIALKYETDPQSIKEYIEVFSKKAKWVGKASDSEADKHGVSPGTLSAFGYTYDMQNDYTVFVLYSQPSMPDNWNHGQRSLVAINEDSNEILFHAEKW